MDDNQADQATYHDIPGNGMAAVSGVMGALASMALLGDMFSLFPLNPWFSIGRSLACAILAVALGIGAKNKFRAVGHQSWLPNFGIISGTVGTAFAAAVSLFRFL